LTVALLVDSEVLRTGLEVLLGRIGRVGAVRSVPDVAGLRQLLRAEPVDVLIVSVQRWPSLEDESVVVPGRAPRVLVVGDEAQIQDASQSTYPPADGFVAVADLSVESLDDRLARTVQGEMPMPPSLARHLLTGNRRVGHVRGSRSVSLTSRESEALALLADGLSNKQIARALGISTHGAKRLVGAVLLKLGSPNRTAAVVTAMKSGLV
jgi:two-component system nitrate/nitrite response regulator NarL